MKKNIFVIDLDHTILNTKKMKSELGVFLNNNPDMTSSEIISRWVQKEEEKKKMLNFFQSKINNFLFDSIEDKLIYLKKKDSILILFTNGLFDFQMSKINALKIKKYFDKIIVTENDHYKTETMKEIVYKYCDDNIFFINDNLDQNLAIQNKFKTVRVKNVNNYKFSKKNNTTNILNTIIIG